MQGIDHPNIVKLITYFENDANIYLVLELGGVKFELNKGQSICCSLQRKEVQRGEGG